MKLAIMQPYFFPYIGYFQLMAAAEVFIVYDNIQYTKKGWINRNRFLLNGRDAIFTLPLSKASDFLDVRGRTLAESYSRADLLNKLQGAYRRAPYFEAVFPLLTTIVNDPANNLFDYIFQSLEKLKDYFGLGCQLRISSSVDIDHALRGQDKVIELCHAFNASTYINPPGGRDLYARADFLQHGLELRFLQPGMIDYPQAGKPFVPWLSIIDVMMFNDINEIKRLITTEYELN